MEFAVEDLQEHMMFLTRRMDSFDLQYALMLVLLELGVPTNCLGFDYIRKAVTYVYSQQGDAQACEAYAVAVAQSSRDSDVDQVEQTIRYAIKKAWEHRCEKRWRRYFPVDESGQVPRPSNTVFISRLNVIMELFERSIGKEAACGKK